jgi:hypothetical protein
LVDGLKILLKKVRLMEGIRERLDFYSQYLGPEGFKNEVVSSFNLYYLEGYPVSSLIEQMKKKEIEIAKNNFYYSEEENVVRRKFSEDKEFLFGNKFFVKVIVK